MNYVDEFELPDCPRCGAATEIGGEIARGWYLLRCPACGWSKTVRELLISDEWLYPGKYLAPSVIGEWLPYFPGDPRRNGLADWQMPKPKIARRERTEDSQRLCVLDTLELAVDCLTAIVATLHEKEPYISKKAFKLQDSLNKLMPLLPEVRKKTRFMEEESGYRIWLYKTMRRSFLPEDLPLSEDGLIAPETCAPYVWGWWGLLWHVWAMMLDCRANCPLVLDQPRIRRIWNDLSQGIEAMCARYQAELSFRRLMKAAAKYRDENLKNKPSRAPARVKKPRRTK